MISFSFFFWDFGSDFLHMKTKNWTSCSKQVNEKPQKSFYGVYFIVQWTSLWKKWWTSLWKKWSMYMWLDSSLWYLNEQEETAWLTFFWWSLSLCRVYKTEALPENEKYERPSKTSDVWRLLMVLWKINQKILELLVYTYWYNVYF